MINTTSVKLHNDTIDLINKHKLPGESRDGTINRILTGRTEKERKYSGYLKELLTEDNELKDVIHDKVQWLKDKNPTMSDDSCYATVCYVYLLKAGYKVSMRTIEDLLCVPRGTITRHYRNLLDGNKYDM